MNRFLTRSGIDTLPLRVVAPMVYVVVGFLWTLGGDVLLAALPSDSERSVAWIGSSKAVLFVIVSGLALYALLRRVEQRDPVSVTTARLTKTLLVVTAGLVVAGGYVLFREHSAAELKDWESALSSNAAAQAVHVDEWLDEHLLAMQLVAEGGLLADTLEAWHADPADELAETILGRIAALRILHEQEILSVMLVSSAGQRLFTTGDAGAIRSDPELVIETLRARGPVFGMPYSGEGADHRSLVSVAIPVRQSDSTPAVAVMVAALDMGSAFSPSVEPIDPHGHRTIQTSLMFVKDGRAAVLSNTPGAAWRSLNGPAATGAGQPGGESNATPGTGIAARAVDHRGNEVFAATRPIAGTNWSVVSTADWAHVRGDTLYLAQLGLAVLALAAMLLVIGVYWIRRETQQTAESQLANAKRSISALTKNFELANRHANDIILLIDPDGRIVHANQRAVETYGYSRHELIGLEVSTLQPEGMNGSGPTLKRFGDTGTLALIFETAHVRKDGSTIPVEVSVRRFEVGDKKFNQAIVRDITKRKEDEATMARMAAERARMARNLRLQFDGMPVACLLTNPDLQVADVNLAFEQLFGWKKHELLGQDKLDLIIAPTDLPAVRQILDSTRTGLGTKVSVNGNVTRDGRPLTCRWTNTALLDEQGKLAGVLSMCENLTDELALKKDVAEREKAIEALAESAPVGVFQLDRTGAVTFINQTLVHMFGVKPQSFGRFPKGLYLGPEDRLRAGGLLREALAGATPPPQEFRYAGPDGLQCWVLIHARPVIDDHGKVMRVVGTATDISIQKRQESELEKRVAERTEEYRAAKERAERAQAVKMDFLAAMSHELRTPLNSIVGFSEVLLEKTVGPLNEKQEQQLIIVRNAAQRQRALISDLLDISRIETGRLEVNRAPVAIGELIQRSVKEFELEARGKGLDLQTIVDPGLGEIVTDGAKVQQIVSNFLSNAVKYTARGSVSVKADRVDGAVLISVTDTGLGIAKEEQERIFEPFVQLRDKNRRRQDGVGLGLAISRRLAVILGGSIEVESVPETGSTFRLRLPALQPAAA